MMVVEQIGQVGFLTLNRLKAYNALSVEMIITMLEQLRAWEHDDAIQAIVIRSQSPDVFCAGGDIKALYQNKHLPLDELMVFFHQEFELNYLLHVYPKPVISLLNGLTMGGGVGIGMHNHFSIAGENIVFGMPETAIGLFPDIGSSHVLNRLPVCWRNAVGVFAEKLNIHQVCQYHLAYAHIPVAYWDGFLDKLTHLLWQQPFEDVASLIKQFKQEVMPSVYPCESFEMLGVSSFSDLMEHVEHIDHAYFAKLREKIPQLSPLSMYVTFEKLKFSEGMNLANCLKLDYQLLYCFMQESDFFEGVRAMMIDKDKHPHWKFKTWQEVPYSVVQEFFYHPCIELTL